jgi:hypothetical protein
MDVELSEFVAGLPKCELHVHPEGTLGVVHRVASWAC